MTKPAPTEEQRCEIRRLRNLGTRTRKFMGSRSISKKMGISEAVVRKELVGVLAPKNPPRPKSDYSLRELGRGKTYTPPDIIADRDRAYNDRSQWNLGQLLFGDPPPHRSALERKK